ncbi:hypothetical protein F2Q68_00012270 [Brassica cretica]|uniref:CHY-type domain-containing protein n=1 Tax=Brassica cretica TaxID=69181 RepID=A0A8S9KPM7_BRACR|nr:hypothetical protein F2Q68_00012270 [Brassica cretica]
MEGVHFNHFVEQPQKTDREKSEMLSPHSRNEETESLTLELESAESLLKEVLDRGLMEHGCPHYRRRCCIRSPCCDEVFGCHHCHNEAKNNISVDPKQSHDIPRQKVEQVICLLCGTEQEVRQTCTNCGVCMGKYFCEACKLYDDDTSKKQYHCDGCGICRIGGHENFFHCYKCGKPISASDNLELFTLATTKSLDLYNLTINQAVVTQSFSRTATLVLKEQCITTAPFVLRNDVTVLPCGHTIHQKCLEEMREHYQYACPLCSKSVCDMSKVWEKFDVEIAATPMPEPYQNKMVQILCNDCGTKSEVHYHVVAQKCPNCKSYNTRQTRG